MAKKVTVVEELLDDVDGGSADETVSFALDGQAYEIDLTRANAAKLRDALALWVGHARKATKGSQSSNPRRRVSVGPDPAAVRAWAKSNGIKVSERGRIPADVVEKFAAAGN